MSNRLFQGVIHQMKDAIDRTIGVVDETSVVIACSELGRIGEVNESITADTLSATVPFVINGHTFKSFGSSTRARAATRSRRNMPSCWRYLFHPSSSIMTKNTTALTLSRTLSSITSSPATSI